MSDDQIQRLRIWCLEEFRRRTHALEQGTATMAEQIDWAIAEYRVRFSEASAMAEKMGLTMNPVELRIALQDCIDG